MFWKKQKIPPSKTIMDYAVGYVLKDAKGNLYYYNADYSFSEHVFRFGYTYDSPDDLEFFLTGPKGKLMLDIGSNHGVFSIFLNKKFERIIAFEPEPNNFNIIEKNIDLNKLRNVELIGSAVSNENLASVPFFVLTSDGHHSLGKVATSEFKETTYVRSIRLDSFFQERNISNIDLLKVDVEGFELNVFEGAGDFLHKEFINRIFFEISKVPLESIERCASSIGLYLEERGYEISDISGKRFSSKELDEVYFGNFIAS